MQAAIASPLGGDSQSVRDSDGNSKSTIVPGGRRKAKKNSKKASITVVEVRLLVKADVTNAKEHTFFPSLQCSESFATLEAALITFRGLTARQWGASRPMKLPIQALIALGLNDYCSESNRPGNVETRPKPYDLSRFGLHITPNH